MEDTFEVAALREQAAPRTMASSLEGLLRRDIIRGELPPGSRLRVRELAERYETGPIPVREALSRLCTGGLVIAVDQKGFRVADNSLDEQADITQTRQDIERLAITRAIRRRDAGWEGEVLAAHHLLRTIPTFGVPDGQHINPAWERAHDAFHAKLVEGCGSTWLANFCGVLRDQAARYRHLSVTAPHSHERDVTAEHARIVDAVMSHDVDLATSLLADHFGNTARLVAEAFDTQKKNI
jgi:GntR family transcriptional regulator, carbon starvation induced regulator